MPEPQTTLASIQQMLAAVEQGHFAAAERMVRPYLDLYPEDETALSILGLSLFEQERLSEATEVYQLAASRFPTNPGNWDNLGTTARKAGQFQEAEAAYAKALQMQPDDPRFLSHMGLLYIEWKRITVAKEYLWRAYQLDPSDFETRIFGAQMALECGDDARARQMLDDWKRWAATLGSALQVELAALLIRLGDNAECEALLRRHLDDPESGNAARARLIVVLERFNRLEEAQAMLAQLPPIESVTDTALGNEICEAQAVVAARDSDVSHATSVLKRLLDRSDDDRWQTTVCFLLAKLCDKQNDYDACVEYLRKAHASQMEHTSRLVPDLVEPSSNPLNIANFRVTHELFERWKPVEAPPLEDSPVFVVGFPRSGTTMLEQMLDAHPGMRSMDERPFLQRSVERMQQIGLQYPEQLGELDTAQCSTLRDVYWSAVAKVSQLRPGQRLVDKNPLSMLRVPMIFRLFPNAKIIFVMRHPCDVVLSCYMQHFNAPAFTAMCSTLPRLADGYAHAMRFWLDQVALLKPQIFEWRYESAIEDFDGNVERVGAFLDLEDISPLHRFSEHARTKGYIGTPSYAQVIQPVYKGAMGRWRRYRKYFEPILPLLEPALEHWGYDA
ncbi:MAG: sulfotransferase [Rhodanobacteraceae bacterium]